MRIYEMGSTARVGIQCYLHLHGVDTGRYSLAKALVVRELVGAENTFRTTLWRQVTTVGHLDQCREF